MDLTINKFLLFHDTPRPISANLSGMLNCSRWIAAMFVMIGHLRDLLFTSFHNVLHPTLLIRIFYFLTGFGHHAVIIFFVMSGFLVGGSAVDQYQSGQFKWESYLIKRITRIYIVFLFALLAGGLLDTLGLTYFNQIGIYNNTHHMQFDSELTTRDISQNLNLATFIGNCFMLQSIKVSVLGSNGPLWSLANEFWYYLLFPILIEVISNNRLKIKLLSFAVGCTIVSILPVNILLYFSIWLLGTLVRKISFPKFPNFFPSFIIFMSSLIIIRTFGTDSYYLDLLLASTFALVVNALHRNMNPLKSYPLLHLRFHKSLADFSYSLYTLHFPLMLFLVSALNSYMPLYFNRQPNIKSFMFFSLFVAITYVYSFYSSLLTEKHTNQLRNFLFSLKE